MEKLRVLIVDDLPDMRMILSGFLSDSGYDVCTASNLQDAQSILKTELIHVAVLDVRLDDANEDNRDGLILMRYIKEQKLPIATIILTGYADVEMVREALHPQSEDTSPALFFLQKTEIDELPKFVQRAVDHIYKKNVMLLIAQGEKEDVEFKSSLLWDYNQRKTNKGSQIVIAKTIAGMMNHKGGTLLIGVNDDGDILGIEKDLKVLRKSNIDGFQLLLTNIVQNYLNLQFMPYIHPSFELIEGKQVCIVSINSSHKPVFLNLGDTKEFWLRAGNSTRKLDVEEASDYIQLRWGKHGNNRTL